MGKFRLLLTAFLFVQKEGTSTKHRMTNDEFYNYLVAEYNTPFAGWDMSYLKGRSVDLHTEPRWDYTATVLAAMDAAETMLDAGISLL